MDKGKVGEKYNIGSNCEIENLEVIKSICNILNDLGININTIPVMDLLQNSTHQVIKSRAYSYKAKTIKSLVEVVLIIKFLNKPS